MRKIFFMKNDSDQKLRNIGKNVIKCKKYNKKFENIQNCPPIFSVKNDQVRSISAKTISDKAFFVEFKSILIKNDPKCLKNNQRKMIFFAKILLSQNCP